VRHEVKAKHSEVAKLRKILAALSPLERDALQRFYVRRQEAVEIFRETGIKESTLRELTHRVKRQYSEMTRGEVDLEGLAD
jgi:DNA-directed RNA polymerase specialized sigma24 family protein